jgi:hypothetical protein
LAKGDYAHRESARPLAVGVDKRHGTSLVSDFTSD